MTLKTPLTLVIAATLALGVGCKKEEEPTTTDTPPPPPPTDPAAANAPGATGEVATYPNMVPQGGTKRTLQAFTVYQAADPNSKVLTRVPANTFINLKSSYGNWMLIEWPSGVGQLSPGWIELRANDSRVAQAEPQDAGTPAPVDAGTAPVDAGGAPVDAGGAPVDAGKADGGGRGTIKIIPKKQ